MRSFFILKKERFMDKLILKDLTEILLFTANSINNIQILSPDKDTMVSIWNVLTPDNLSVVQIKNTEGNITANYIGLILESETSVVQDDGQILTTFSLREKTEVEKLRERLVSVEETTDALVIESLTGGKL